MGTQMSSLDMIEKIRKSEPLKDQKAVEASIMGLMDYTASSFLAKDDAVLANFREQIIDGQKGKAVLVGRQQKISQEAAALYNGFQAHLLDLDDVHGDVRGHPSAVILSALMSAAAPETSGARFLAAYIIGVEIMARLGKALNPYHYGRGWHNTATLGSIAAAGAICYLEDVETESFAQSMSVAATLAGGLRLQSGTPVKPLHAGIAARNAVNAYSWVKSGIYAEKEFLFGKGAFLDVYGEQADPTELFLNWGQQWKIYDPGLWFKKYPFCSAAMAGADAAQQLYQLHFFKPEEIKRIAVGFFPGKDAALIVREPKTGEEGRFSIEYITWLGVTGTSYTIDRFSPAAISSAVRDQLKKVERYEIDQEGSLPYTKITVETREGSSYSRQVIHPLGSPQNPLSLKDELEKLTMALGSSADRTTILHQMIRELPKKSMKSLLSAIGKS